MTKLNQLARAYKLHDQTNVKTYTAVYSAGEGWAWSALHDRVKLRRLRAKMIGRKR